MNALEKAPIGSLLVALYVFACMGLAACGVAAVWLAYHVVRALLFYVGAL